MTSFLSFLAKTAGVLLFVGAVLLSPFMLMLGLGMVHDGYPAIPALGFLHCVGLLLVVASVSGMFHAMSK